MHAKVLGKASEKNRYKVIGDAEFALHNKVHSSILESPSKLLFAINQRGTVIDVLRE